MKMKAYMFPGQGSQSTGMGESLFDGYSELVDKVDNILGYSIKELCLENPDRKLNNTQFTQPAIFVVSALSYYRKVEGDGSPDYLLGHSLGEFNALHAAGCFDLEAGVKLVKKRGELMAKAENGGMAAILNSSKEDIERVLRENELNNIDLANYNTGSQIVISGLRDEIEKAQPFFQEGKVMYFPLNTGGAFHSRFMQEAGESFKSYIKRFKFSDPSIPVVSNVTAREYEEDSIISNLSAQISNTVRWLESVEYLESLQPDNEIVVEEVGYGDVLTKMYATIKSERKAEKRREAKSGNAAAKQEKPVDKGKPDIAKPKKKEAKKKEAKTEVVNIDENKNDASGREPQKTKNDDASLKHNTERKVAEVTNGKTSLSAQEKVDDWNRKYSVGTQVRSSNSDYGELITRTDGVVLFGHRAAVYMEGYKGYFDLDEIKVENPGA